MGAGASVPDKMDEATCQTMTGEKFDKAKFDEIKDAEGFITKEQLMAAMPPSETSVTDKVFATSRSLSIEDGTPTGLPPEAFVEAVPAAGGNKVEINLLELPQAIERSIAKGLTPMVVDDSPDHKVDTFFGYNFQMLDAKQLSLGVAQKKATKEENLDKARKSVVSAMKHNKTLVISMQQGSPSFNDWFNSETEFPVTALLTSAGSALKENTKNGWPTKLYREADLQSGIAACQPEFQVVVSTWFGPDDFEEFLFDEGMGMSNIPKELFEFIVVKSD